jgi:D-sedoheptulose 7-phosphate isomerase
MMIKAMLSRHPRLMPLERDIRRACGVIQSALIKGNKLLLAGNGGSASDCEHMSGELLKNFMRKRPLPAPFQALLRKKYGSEGKMLADTLQTGLPAIPLSGFTAFHTAFGNDVCFDLSFAQLVQALGKKGDVLVCFTTSGRSKNLIYAAQVARAMGLKVAAFTGRGGRPLKDYCDAVVDVPGNNSYAVQEGHLPVYHAICLEIEEALIRTRRRS